MPSLDVLTDWLEKARPGLTPKKVEVRRGGKTFEAIRWVRPGNESEESNVQESVFNANRPLPTKDTASWSDSNVDAFFTKLFGYTRRKYFDRLKANAPEDWEALSEYASEETQSYMAINNNLRQDKPAPLSVAKYIPRLDRLISQTSLPEAVAVYRGMNLSLDKVLQFQTGTVFSDKGYVSTSLLPEEALEFAADGGALFEVELPKDTNVAWVNGEESYELLLSREKRFQVTKADWGTHPFTGKRIALIKARVVN